jgi:PAS domain S-box-containing protein
MSEQSEIYIPHSTILIVDDVESARDTLEALLTGEDHHLAFAADGAEALKKVAELHPDLVLLDVMMPGMDGFEVCRRLKSDRAVQYIPIVMVTALDSKEDLVQGLGAGADDFLSKPVNGLELKARVRSLLRAKRQYDERVQAEEALRRLKEFNEGIVKGVNEGLLIEDTAGIITFVNPAMEALLGYTADELVGQHWQTIVLPDEIERIQEKTSRRLASIAEQYETRLRARDDSEIPVLVSAQPMFEGETFTGVLSAFTDITKRKRDEEAQKRFISNVSHELRTPVHNIRSSIALLGKYEPALLPADQRERLLAAIDSESKRLGELIEDILTLSRLDRGTTVLRRKETDLNSLLRQACDRLQSALGRWGGTVRQALATRPILVEIDPGLMLQVAVNLLDNAVKYSPAGGQITLSSGQGETEAWFSVRDQGVGMTGEQTKRIFERFYRVTTVHETPGTGIGLAIAKEIVELHGGRIGLQSEPEEGSCFTVYLPVSA